MSVCTAYLICEFLCTFTKFQESRTCQCDSPLCYLCALSITILCLLLFTSVERGLLCCSFYRHNDNDYTDKQRRMQSALCDRTVVYCASIIRTMGSKKCCFMFRIVQCMIIVHTHTAIFIANRCKNYTATCMTTSNTMLYTAKFIYLN